MTTETTWTPVENEWVSPQPVVKMRPMLCTGTHPNGGTCRKLLCLTSLKTVDPERAVVVKKCSRCAHITYLG